MLLLLLMFLHDVLVLRMATGGWWGSSVVADFEPSINQGGLESANMFGSSYYKMRNAPNTHLDVIGDVDKRWSGWDLPWVCTREKKEKRKRRKGDQYHRNF